MAKGDHKRMQNEIGEQKNNLIYGYGGSAAVPPKTSSPWAGFKRTTTPGSPAVQGQGGWNNLYNTITSTGMNSYDDIMNSYRGFLTGGNSGDSGMGEAMAGFRGYAESGGLSDKEKADIRARAISPTRSIYSRGMQEVQRQRSLQGGYSPNATAALAKMARELSYNISDVNTNANASIADLVSRNRLAGISGMGNLGQAMSEMDIRKQLGGLSGMSSLYGGHINDLMQAQGLQNQIAQIMLGGREANARIPGNFQQAMGNIGSVIGLGGKVAGGLAGLGGGGKNTTDPWNPKFDWGTKGPVNWG